MKTTTIEYRSSLLGESYTETRHKSGLTIYVFPKDMTTTHAILAVKCGSLDRSVRLADRRLRRFPAGIAHYLEHKLFDNENGKDSFAIFSTLGADANAFTTYTHTAYFFSATRNEKAALKELLTFAANPYFTEATVNKERGIIEEEIKMDRDLPWDRAFQNLLVGLYGKHPLADDICGSRESIARITPEKLYDFYRLFYRPSNMILSVSGRLSLEEVLSVADRIFPAKNPENDTAYRVLARNRRAVACPRVQEKMPVAKPIFQFGFKDPRPGKDPAKRLRRDAAMLILNEVLFSKSGDFYNSLFEESLVTPSFSAGYSGEKGFAFNCISGESNQPDEVLARLRSYLRSIKQTGISEEELERSRRVLYADEIRSYDSTEEIAGRLVSFALDEGNPFVYPELIQAVTKSEAEALLREIFQEEFLSLSLILPTEERKNP